MIHLLFRELGLDIEGADSLHLISKEVNAVRIFAREREDIEDTTTHGVLPRLIDIIDPLESVAVQDIGHEHIVQLLARMDLKRVLFQHVAGYDLLGQRVGIGYNHELLLRVLQDTQGLGPQYLVRRINMPVLDIPPVGRGEEIDGRTRRKLHQIMIEVPGLLQIVQHTNKAPPSFREKRRNQHRRARPAQPLGKQVTHLIPLQYRRHRADLRMSGVKA